jgi:hypothetical protein
MRSFEIRSDQPRWFETLDRMVRYTWCEKVCKISITFFPSSRKHTLWAIVLSEISASAMARCRQRHFFLT